MPNLTVQAMDSAAAMDEIVSKLGPDAVILSTTKLNGKVVMEAASGNLSTPILPANEKKFTNIFSEQMIKTPHSRSVDNKKRDSNESAIQANEAFGNPMLPSKSEMDSLRKQLTELQKMMDGLFVTDLDGLNQNLSSNSRVILQQAGFSSQVLDDFKGSYLGQTYQDGCNIFLTDLSSHLTHPDSESLLAKKFIFVTGQSGTGRTTMVGKLTAALKESFPHKEVMTVEITQEGQRPNTQLKDFCRLLNSQVHTINLDVTAANFNEIKPNEVMVVDLAVPINHAATKLQDMQGQINSKDMGILATIPASTSSNMITLTLNELENLELMVALTKLDECDITTSEFSSLAKVDAKIGLFSASKSIMDAPIFASQNVLMQYLKENLVSTVKQDPIYDRPDI
jgi:flagellar biosynthesis GTPase FlhF